MEDLNFNIYALSEPITVADYSALMDEALRLAIDLTDRVESLTDQLAAKAAPESA